MSGRSGVGRARPPCRTSHELERTAETDDFSAVPKQRPLHGPASKNEQELCSSTQDAATALADLNARSLIATAQRRCYEWADLNDIVTLALANVAKMPRI
jgi:hypothetical protein